MSLGFQAVKKVTIRKICCGFTPCTIVSFIKVSDKDIASIFRIAELHPSRCLIRCKPTVLHSVTARILPSVFRSSNFIFSYEDETDNEAFIHYRT
jgi:hypothetical protein